MLPSPSAWQPGIDAPCRIIVKVFPFFASGMPVTKKGNSVHNLNAYNPFIFNRLWRALFPPKAESAPRIGPPASAQYQEQTTRQKSREVWPLGSVAVQLPGYS